MSMQHIGTNLKKTQKISKTFKKSRKISKNLDGQIGSNTIKQKPQKSGPKKFQKISKNLEKSRKCIFSTLGMDH